LYDSEDDVKEHLYSIDRVEQTLRVENITLTVFSHVGIFQSESVENARLRQMMLHEHTHWEMFGGVYGQLKVEFTDHSHILEPGDVIIIRPHVLHNTMLMTADSQRSSVPFYYIRNTNTFVHDLYKSLTEFMGEQPYILIRNRPDICQVIQQVMEAGMNYRTLLACMLMSEMGISVLAKSA
jgi:mannose-6-phosphate isomerase-like protein (cupin superfamily)